MLLLLILLFTFPDVSFGAITKIIHSGNYYDGKHSSPSGASRAGGLSSLLSTSVVIANEQTIDAAMHQSLVVLQEYPILSDEELTTYWQKSLAIRPDEFTAEEFRLIRHLMTNYTKLSRPVLSANESVVVAARLFPIKILHLYEKNEIIEMTIRLQLNWRDPMLAWYPPDFDNQKQIVLPNGQLWTPGLQFANSVSDIYALMRDTKFDFKVHSDGNVWWHLTGNVATRCELIMVFFPFDVQSCPIVLEAASFTHDKLNLTIRKDKSPFSLSMYTESGDWTMLGVAAQQHLLWVTNSTAFTRVEFRIRVARKAVYFIINVIFPCGLLSALQMMTFLFPLGSTERVPEATSVLLSVIVFQSVISDQLPKSNSIPFLVIYVDLLTVISAITVAEAICITGLAARKEKATKVPKWCHPLIGRFLPAPPKNADGQTEPVVANAGESRDDYEGIEPPKAPKRPCSLVVNATPAGSSISPIEKVSATATVRRQKFAKRTVSLFSTGQEADEIVIDCLYFAQFLDNVVSGICLVIVGIVPIVLFSIVPTAE